MSGVKNQADRGAREHGGIHGRPAATPDAIVVTIDGPAGTGKSSVARELARKLGLDFLDTGAMYRAAAAIVLDRQLDVSDHAGVVDAVARCDMHFDFSQDPPTLIAGGSPMMSRIRGADVTGIVSRVAAIPELRRLMVQKQREIRSAHPRLVTEGRDQGSVVFPDAAVKFYLDAAPEVRAARRRDQLRRAGVQAEQASVLSELIGRDRLDSSRSDGPLTCPDDAVVIDTSTLGFDEVVEMLCRVVREKTGLATEAAGCADRPGERGARQRTSGSGEGG